MDVQSSQGQTSESTSAPSIQSVGNEVARGIVCSTVATPSPSPGTTAMNLPPTDTQVSGKKRKDPINKSPLLYVWEKNKKMG